MPRTVSSLYIDELIEGAELMPDGTDLETALMGGGRHRWLALAIVAWLHDRRANPEATLAAWRGKTMDEVLDYLGVDKQALGADATDPTQPNP